MNILYPENWPQFFTATIQEWKHLLAEDKYKEVVINCLKYFVENHKVQINAYVIMNNHIHLIRQATAGNILSDIQTSFKKFTSQQFIKLLEQDGELKKYEVNRADRKYHFWKRNSLGIDLFTDKVFHQKLDYIHYNPVKAGICNYPEEYRYSSAVFYKRNIDEFGILVHYAGT